EYGNLLYSFIDTVVAIVPYYWIRAIGGLLYLIGFFMFTYNIYIISCLFLKNISTAATMAPASFPPLARACILKKASLPMRMPIIG
ncbi:hypothetical protein VWM68_10700, partial [Campylobacter coli]